MDCVAASTSSGALMSGFYKRAREEVFTVDGFYPTGDLAKMDEDDWVWFLGRRGAEMGNKIWSFGKSKAKVSDKGQNKITFADVAGVDEAKEAREGDEDPLDKAGAGDQGMMFGYATNETESMMPLAVHLAHRLAEKLTEVRKNGTLDYLRPDGKTQVSVRYIDERPVAVEQVLISTQHDEDADTPAGRIADDLWEHVVVPVLPEAMYDAEQLRGDLLVNPTGNFVIGGPVGDCGLTGRKIIVDTYGGKARHGGGAFSGKDPSKVDRSAAYAARYVAKNIVAAGLAERAEVQVAYAIGVAKPVSIMVDTFGTETIPPARIKELVDQNFDLRPAAFREYLSLHSPIYSATAAYGHFGRNEKQFTWERTDRADALRAAAAE